MKQTSSSSADEQDNAGLSDVTTLVKAVEKRFGWRLHVGFHTVLAERAFKLIGQEGWTDDRANG